MFRFELGDQVRETITGYKGHVVSRTQWFNGCIRYGIQGKLTKDGKVPDIEAFDEQQLELVKAAAPQKTIPPLKQVGGPQRPVRNAPGR